MAVVVRVRDEAHRDREAGEQERPRVQVEDRAPLAEADPRHAVVEVVRVGRPRRAPVLEPPRDHEARVEERHGEDRERADERDQRVRLQRALHGGAAEQVAEQQRAAVAHEDRRRVEVVDQEAERRARDDRRQHAGARAPEVERDDREGDRADRAHAGREPVDAVGEVHDVHQPDEADHRQRAAEPRAEVERAEERQRDVLDAHARERPGSARRRPGRAASRAGDELDGRRRPRRRGDQRARRAGCRVVCWSSGSQISAAASTPARIASPPSSGVLRARQPPLARLVDGARRAPPAARRAASAAPPRRARRGRRRGRRARSSCAS